MTAFVLELLHGLGNGLFLLWTEDDGIVFLGHLATIESRLAMFHSFDGFEGGLQVTFKPFGALFFSTEVMAFDTRAEKHFMDGLVVERNDAAAFDVKSQLCMEKVVINPRRLRVLVDSGFGRLVQFMAIRRQIKRAGFRQRRFADFYTSRMSFVVDAKDVNQFSLQ